MSEEFLGAVKLVSYNFAQRGFAFCAGQTLSIAQNQALFSLLGTTYGGNGVTTFALPDLRGRAPVGQGQGPGLSSYTLGQVGGAENVTLTSNTVPAHTHPFMASTDTGTTNTPSNTTVLATSAGGVFYAPHAGSGFTLDPLPADTVSSVGGSQPHNNIQPTLAISFVIALQGVFPSRN